MKQMEGQGSAGEREKTAKVKTEKCKAKTQSMKKRDSQEDNPLPPSLSLFMIVYSSSPLYQPLSNLQHKTQVEMMN